MQNFEMEDNAYMFTFQIQLDSCMDSLLKRTTSEITALVKDKFSQTQNDVVSKETEDQFKSVKHNGSKRQSEMSEAEEPQIGFGESFSSERRLDTKFLLEFQTQLNSCLDVLLKQAMVEIIAWVKESVVQFRSKIAAKEAEIRQLTEQIQILETHSEGTLKAVNFASSGNQLGESPVVFEEIERIDSDAVGLEQEKGATLMRNVPEAACFVEAEPSLDYELTVATTAMEGLPEDDGPQEDKEEVVVEVSHTFPRTWDSEEVEESLSLPGQNSADPPTPFQQALELGGSQPDTPSHSCSQCWKSFSKEWILRRHMRKHSDGSAPSTPAAHDCPHCGRGFKHRKGLASHLRSHSGEKPYSCDVCGQRFTRPESAKKHRRLHSGVKPYGCPQCPRRFFRSDGLKSHMRTHDSGRRLAASSRPPPPKLCMCSHCGKAYANATQVANHERTHTGERPYECSQCHKRFRHSGALSVHRITHQRDRPHACPTCPKSFRCAKHLKRHLLTHSEVRPFSCDQCSLSFRTANELKAHKIRHGLQRTHACPDCGKSFKTEYEVKLHRRAHNGERPYTCPDCNRTFRRLHHLTSHRLTHTGERPYACDMCQRRFIRAREMRNHKRKVHLAIEEPLRCVPCQVSFDSLPLLEAHRRALHGLAEAEEKLLEGLQKFPKILPRQTGVDQGAGANQGLQQQQGLSVNQGVHREGKVLGPVVFVLSGQGVPVPVLTSTAVMTPMTTVLKVPIMPVPRTAAKTQRKAPAAKAARKASTRSLPKSPVASPLSSTQTKAVSAKAASKGQAKARTRSSTKPPSPSSPPSTQIAPLANVLVKAGPKACPRSLPSAPLSPQGAGVAMHPAVTTAKAVTRSSFSRSLASLEDIGPESSATEAGEPAKTEANIPIAEKPAV
ncbi:hypothetical protein AGOR_G00182400 [Albula goreensis]|uniref:C2H2-type domain-containing protein n=1 Tax=Albula goreensis TaxID=1534307 RepID=A0A8T3CSM1_9TELE|nr:hypothetical protein AGOR_G00182400 [Albula goreensis]